MQAFDVTVPTKRAVSDLDIGESGRIVRVEGSGGFRHRLLEMGLTVGSVVRLIRAAPLGDPLELQIRGYRLSVRKAEAATVIIESD